MNVFQRIRLIWLIKRAMGDANEEIKKADANTEVKKMDEIKPGLMTSEFKGKTAVQLALILDQILKLTTGHSTGITAEQAGLLIAGLELGYGAFRTALKMMAEWTKGKEAVALATPTKN